MAVNYSVLFVHGDGRWVAERVAANRRDLTRTTAGWRVMRLFNRLLDGGADALALLSGAEPPEPQTAGPDGLAASSVPGTCPAPLG